MKGFCIDPPRKNNRNGIVIVILFIHIFAQSLEKIAEDMEEEIETVLPIYQLAIESAPEYDCEKIY